MMQFLQQFGGYFGAGIGFAKQMHSGFGDRRAVGSEMMIDFDRGDSPVQETVIKRLQLRHQPGVRGIAKHHRIDFVLQGLQSGFVRHHGNVVVLDDILHELKVGFQGTREKQGGFFSQETQIQTQGEHGAQGIRIGVGAEQETAVLAKPLDRKIAILTPAFAGHGNFQIEHDGSPFPSGGRWNDRIGRAQKAGRRLIVPGILIEYFVVIFPRPDIGHIRTAPVVVRVDLFIFVEGTGFFRIFIKRGLSDSPHVETLASAGGLPHFEWGVLGKAKNETAIVAPVFVVRLVEIGLDQPRAALVADRQKSGGVVRENIFHPAIRTFNQ